VAVRIERVEGNKAAPPIPIMPLMAISIVVDLDKAAPREKQPKIIRPPWRKFFRLIRSPREPIVSKNPAKANT
jgi:hypothetical protein